MAQVRGKQIRVNEVKTNFVGIALSTVGATVFAYGLRPGLPKADKWCLFSGAAYMALGHFVSPGGAVYRLPAAGMVIMTTDWKRLFETTIDTDTIR